MRDAKRDLLRLKNLKQSKSYACNVDFNWLVNTLQSYIGGWVEGREIGMDLVEKLNRVEAREGALRDDIEKYWRKRVGVLEQEQSDFIGCINVYKKAMQSILSECESKNSAMESLDAILNIVNETFRKANNTFYGPHRPTILDRLETLERENAELREALRNLLLSADCSWEERGEGHDWAEACQAARRVMGVDGHA